MILDSDSGPILIRILDSDCWIRILVLILILILGSDSDPDFESDSDSVF